jgi:hypothetical protein
VPGQVIGLLIGVFLVFVAWQMIYRKGTVNTCENLEDNFGFYEKELLSKTKVPENVLVSCKVQPDARQLLSDPDIINGYWLT